MASTGYNYLETYNGADIRIGISTKTGFFETGGIPTANKNTVEGFIDDVLEGSAFTSVRDEEVPALFTNLLASLKAKIDQVDDMKMNQALLGLGFELGTQLADVTGFTATSGGAGLVTLSWDFESAVENYTIMQATQPDFSDEVEIWDDPGEEPVELDSLAADTYYYRIKKHITGYQDSDYVTDSVAVS